VNQTTKDISARRATRREFLKKTTLAGAALAAGQNLFKTPVYGQNQAPAPGNVVGANNRIVVGYIGVGKQGADAHITLQKKFAADNNIAQAAVCDLSAHYRDAAKAMIGADCKAHENFEELLANKDIDAVTISTTDVWHADTAMAALQAGKHVYLEKPMARYLGEAFALYDLAKKYPKLSVQIGSQACSDPKWLKARDMIKAGKIGKVVLLQESYMRNSAGGEWNEPPFVMAGWMTPQDLPNWNKWEGKVKNKVAYNAERFVRWRKFYPYCAGPLGDLAPHRITPLMLAMGDPEFPTRVVCLGQNPVHADKNTPGAAERDCPEDVQLIAEFPSNAALMLVAGTVNEVGLPSVIRGYKGTLKLGPNSVHLDPEKFTDDIDQETVGNLGIETIESHEKNWFDCIRSGAVPNANLDLAIRVQTVLSLAEMSNRLNMMCLFDEKSRKITNGDGKEVPAITYGTLEKS
jgi:predicted dehydrogenase